MVSRTRVPLLTLVGLAFLAAPVQAQFSEFVTGFEEDREGNPLPFQPGSFGDLQVVMFQDPAEADVTTDNIVPDVTPEPGALPSTEESFVADFTGDGFPGAQGSDQSLDIRFQWSDPTDPDRWVLVETFQSPTLGDPSIHLEGVIRMRINFPVFTPEFPALDYTDRIGVALLVRETGNDIPQGFRDGGTGALEFVGVSSVTGADTASPVPVPTTFYNGPTTSGDAGWIELVFNLDALEGAGEVIGWTAEGGDGVLDATGVGDGVNRGVLAGLVLTVDATDTTSEYVEFLVDNIRFEAPVVDPTYPPTVSAPAVAGDTTVRVTDVLSSATNVALEIDRSDDDNEDPFTADETINQAPDGGFFLDINVSALQIGDRLRARQTNPSGTSDYSLVVAVNPPAAFTFTLSLDEDGNLGAAPADFEFVGANSKVGNAPQGKPVFRENGVWQNFEFSLIPGVEPVIDFAGGNGLLEPDGGSYNIDSVFFSIDTTEPFAGPYDVFIDHVYVITADDQEIIISDAEGANPFPNFRGQTTTLVAGSAGSSLSALTSFDGTSSNLIEWEWETTSTSNTVGVYRPGATFADTAKAVGFWLLVEDARTNGLPLPEVETLIIGTPPAVQVTNIDPSATNVDLLVNGAVGGSVDPEGATIVNITPAAALQIGDSVSAVYQTASDESDVAYPRGVAAPPAPAVQGPLVEGQTTVTVSGVLNAANAAASLVTLYDGDTVIDSQDPNGSSAVVFNVAPALVAGQSISAEQTVNGATSSRSTPVGVGTGVTPCAVINEFVYDDVGLGFEYVELYNSGPDPIDISNWTLRQANVVAPPGDSLPDFTIPAATTLPAGDYYVIGNSGVPNVDLVIPGGSFDNANTSLELLDQNGVVVDTVIYELNKGPVAASPGEGGIWGNYQTYATDGSSWSRWFDGYDTDNNGRDFGSLPVTPGASNAVAALPKPFTETFDGGTADNPVVNWRGSFQGLRYINPGSTGAANPNAIPASPQGGLAATMWDNAGGGDAAYLTDEPRFNVGFSVQVYIDATTSPFTVDTTAGGEREQWSIGLGTTGSLYNQNFPPIAQTGGNGDTGLSWRFVKWEAEPDGSNDDDGLIGTVSLQLVYENDGGSDGQVLFDVPEANLTDGWHTLTLERNYDQYSASFDGLNTSGTVTANGPSTMFIGYREFVGGTPSTLRPPTIDNLQISIPAEPALNACCLPCDCIELATETDCSAIGGAYFEGETCEDGDLNGVADICEAFVPPAPTVVGPLCDGGMVVTVTDIVPEATEVTVYADGAPVTTATTGGADTLAIFVAPPLMDGEVITATASTVDVEGNESDPVTVGICPDPEATVVLNEFSYDQSGFPDTLEFVELYNAGDSTVDIGGWALRAYDDAPPADDNPDYGIPAGTILAAGDYYVVGDSGIPNVDLVLEGDLWEGGVDAIEVIDNVGNILDTVIYELNKGTLAGAAQPEGGIWGNFWISPGANLTWSRYLDGYDTDNNGRDFGLRLWTPGESNLGAGSITSVVDIGDVDALGLSAGDPHPGLQGSFVDPQVIDPTVAGGANPAAIPVSPQGGLCSTAWDPAGGGNTSVSEDVIVGSFYDLYVYIDTTFYGEGGAESMQFGLKGTSGPFHNFPDPQGLLFGDVVTANGSTGIGWLYEKEDSASVNHLHLIDFGDGGDSSPGPNTPTDWNVVTTIDMSAMPSGWHRICLSYDPATGDAVGKFDGQTFSFTTDPDLIGNFHIAYQESLAGTPGKLRPPTFDIVVSGDIDLDGDVDLADYEILGTCLGGPEVTTPPGGCSAADFNASDLDCDADVDEKDFAVLQAQF